MFSFVVWPFVLRRGHSPDPSGGACAMDAISWLMHGEHGDAPECACPVIGAYVIRGNDMMPDDIRQRLLPYLHRIAGSVSPAHEERRARIFQLAALRVFAARALEDSGLHAVARTLRDLPDDADLLEASKMPEQAMNKLLPSQQMAVSSAVAAQQLVGANAASWAAKAGCNLTWEFAWQDEESPSIWDDYFGVLDQALNAGPQGEPWSADVMAQATAEYVRAGGPVE